MNTEDLNEAAKKTAGRIEAVADPIADKWLVRIAGKRHSYLYLLAILAAGIALGYIFFAN